MGRKRYDTATVQDERLTFRISADRYAALRLEAAFTGQPVGTLVRSIVDKYLAAVDADE